MTDFAEIGEIELKKQFFGILFKDFPILVD